MMPKAAGPSSSPSRTSSGSRAQTAEAKKKKAQARRMAARMAGEAAAKRSPARTAEGRRSGGSPLRGGAGPAPGDQRHSSARNATAFSAKAAGGPAAAKTKPPSAGPSARARLKPTPFSAIADQVVPRHQFRRRRRPGREDHRGAGADGEGQRQQAPGPEQVRGQPGQRQPGRDPELRRDQGEPPVQDVGQRAAGQRERNTGSIAAACTRLTMIGEGSSEVISHPAPVFWIHSPVLLARLAIQSGGRPGGGAERRR